jgi:hypothetical protein
VIVAVVFVPSRVSTRRSSNARRCANLRTLIRVCSRDSCVRVCRTASSIVKVPPNKLHSKLAFFFFRFSFRLGFNFQSMFLFFFVGRCRPQLARLFSWRYPTLQNLPCTTQSHFFSFLLLLLSRINSSSKSSSPVSAHRSVEGRRFCRSASATASGTTLTHFRSHKTCNIPFVCNRHSRMVHQQE